jgi:hypothetical protein
MIPKSRRIVSIPFLLYMNSIEGYFKYHGTKDLQAATAEAIY